MPGLYGVKGHLSPYIAMHAETFAQRAMNYGLDMKSSGLIPLVRPLPGGRLLLMPDSQVISSPYVFCCLS